MAGWLNRFDNLTSWTLLAACAAKRLDFALICANTGREVQLVALPLGINTTRPLLSILVNASCRRLLYDRVSIPLWGL